MKRGLEWAAAIVISYAIMELYLVLRPVDLSDQIGAWLETSRGRFETYYAERRRGDERDRNEHGAGGNGAQD